MNTLDQIPKFFLKFFLTKGTPLLWRAPYVYLFAKKYLWPQIQTLSRISYAFAVALMLSIAALNPFGVSDDPDILPRLTSEIFFPTT